MKLVMTLRVEWEVDDLEQYKATTIQEAAENQKKWLEDGVAWLGDFVEDMEIVSLEGVE